MFTGIVQSVGTLLAATPTAAGRRLIVDAAGLQLGPVATGDSVCVAGVCLTVAGLAGRNLSLDVITETLNRTTLGRKNASDRVNLELSLQPRSFLGGHFVQGHVDAVGQVLAIQKNPLDWRLTVRLPADAMELMIPKGSVSIEGVSMTIAAVTPETFTVAVIPTTLDKTTLGSLAAGDKVNIESDILTRTVVHTLKHLLGGRGQVPPATMQAITREKLTEAGFVCSAARPILGITMGDPAGIGAEVIVKALADPEIRKLAKFVVFGLNELMAYAADLAETEPFWWRDQHERLRPYDHDVVVLDYDEFSVLGLDSRQPTRAGGAASMAFCLDAITAAQKRQIDAIVTGPICKESWKLAGFDRWPGHTELLAEKTKARRHAMMFASLPPDSPHRKHANGNGAGVAPVLMAHKGLRVVLATIHEPLFELRNTFKIGTVFDPIDLGHAALKDWFGIEHPKIAVCGLNPHAGENGQFGDEEKRIIEPAIMMARQQGMDVQGPFPGDTIFIKAAQGAYDLVVAMYHDQGLIPVKLLDFSGSVNLTLGLPVIRTSVDHGTAFDIVGKNKADASSMKAAIVMAAGIAEKTRAGRESQAKPNAGG